MGQKRKVGRKLILDLLIDYQRPYFDGNNKSGEPISDEK